MPNFMRKHSRIHKISMEKGPDTAKRFKLALYFLKEEKKSFREIARITNFGKSTPGRKHKCLRNDDQGALAKMLSPSSHKPGASTAVTNEEEKRITEHLIFAAKRGFAADKDMLKSIMTQIASDGRRKLG